jgi:hypothetical protein
MKSAFAIAMPHHARKLPLRDHRAAMAMIAQGSATGLAPGRRRA